MDETLSEAVEDSGDTDTEVGGVNLCADERGWDKVIQSATVNTNMLNGELAIR